MNSGSGSAPKKSVFGMPGFGKPLNYIPGTIAKVGGDTLYFEPEESSDGKKLFPNAVNTFHLDYSMTQVPLITVREITMLQLMNEFTDRPDWHLDIFDKRKSRAWKSKILAKYDKEYVSKRALTWCIKELQYKAGIFRDVAGAISVYNGDVVKSDIAVSNSLMLALRSATSVLETTRTRGRDLYSNLTRARVLVDPFLYPLIFGRTRVLLDRLVPLEEFVDRCGEGVVVPVPSKYDGSVRTMESLVYNEALDEPYSRSFQWLPSDVDISGNDGSVEFTSYINNLHPREHTSVYVALEHIIARAIPLWNMSLTPLRRVQTYRRITYHGPIEGRDGEDLCIQPNPGVFEPPSQLEEVVDLRNQHKELGLQVIVKLETINLTPGEPKFPEGDWKMDGQLNEHICATALYCYDSTNITTSEVSFRQQPRVADTDTIKFTPGYLEWLGDVYDLIPCQPAVQNVGEVVIKQGRLVTWPNVLQHQFKSFELADPTQPGRLKLLTIFLVDPNIRIISTANAPCQQKSWWVDAIRRGGSKLAELPLEVQDLIFDYVDDSEFLLSLEEAYRLKTGYMAEREVFQEMQTDVFLRNYFTSNVRPEVPDKWRLGNIFPNFGCDHYTWYPGGRNSMASD